MPIYQEIVDYDSMFRNLAKDPMIINDIVINNISDREKIKDLLLTSYSSDVFAMAPSCLCGKTVGEFNLDIVCKECGTRVVKKESDIESILWIKCLHEEIKFFDPHVWSMLDLYLQKRKFNLLKWLTDTRYTYIIEKPTYLTLIESIPDFRRGYDYFLNNYEKVMNVIINLKEFKTKDSVGMVKFINDNKHKFLTDYLPIPNKTLLIIENTSKGRYFNYGFSNIIDAVYTVLGSKEGLPISNIANRTSRIMYVLSEFYSKYYHDFLNGKPGLFRKHVFGGRSNFSARGVIVSINGHHRYDEIHMPWGMSLSVLRPHVINKLTKRGFTVKQSVSMIYSHISKYSELLDEILKELIRETSYIGIPIMFQRNPSLLGGSAQRLFITIVKTDPGDPSISMSDLVAKAFNADHDGDLDIICIRPLSIRIS